MIKVTSTLRGVSPYSQSAPVEEPKKPKESPDAYEERTWALRAHYDDERNVIVPPMALKNCLDAAAKLCAIPTKGKALMTKHFECGVMCMDPMVLNVTEKDMKPERLFVPSSGVAGDGKRVWKTFPCWAEWEGTATFFVVDMTVTKAAFAQVLKEAGLLVGLGRFRPQKRGYYGRFQVVGDIMWEEETIAEAA